MSPEPDQQPLPTTAPLIENVVKDVLAAKPCARRSLFQNLMALNEEKIGTINQETVSQQNNDLWHSVRNGRLTASNFGLAVKAKNDSKLLVY